MTYFFTCSMTNSYILSI